VLQALIQDEIDRVRDSATWAASYAAMEEDRMMLNELSGRWKQVSQGLRGGTGPGA